MRGEWLARIIVVVLVAVGIAIPVVAGWRDDRGGVVHARMAESGGWTPENLKAEVGKPLHLRLTSDDVMHGFAVGQSEQEAVDVMPGEMTEVTLTFERPGKYTFYCTRWCGINHWRMRGTIDVSGETASSATAPAEAPLYLRLGLDIDAARRAETVPERRPSAARGALLAARVPEAYWERDYYLAHSPLEVWKALGSEAGSKGPSDQERWDAVAWVWKSNTTPEALREGERLFAANCAACHGEGGGGDGVFADQLDQTRSGEHEGMQSGEVTRRPADFSDPEQMLSASPALLQGKILRGGMGTGMPYWGPIFTDEQTWALVAYLYSIQFDLEDGP